MTLPLVSVVIPTFNRRHKLERALRCVFEQTFKDIEIIVVDNASNDGTRDFIQGLREMRLNYLCLEMNLGAPAARNRGIKAASAALIAFLDDDDQWYPGKLEAQVRKFKAAPSSTGVIYCGTEVFDEEKGRLLGTNRPRHRGNVYQRMLEGTILSSNTALVKKECFEKEGGFDELLTSCQDWDMWLRISRNYEFDYVPQVMARVNMHQGQLSADYAALIPGRTRMVEKHAQEFARCPRIYVIHLKRMGKLHCINGTLKQAFEWFGKAMAVRPSECIKILAWCLWELPFTLLFLPARKFKKYKGQA